MTNGYFIADTNTLKFAYEAGGTKLLDAYAKYATDVELRQFAITNRIEEEIKAGPLRAELGKWIDDRKIPALPNPDTDHKLSTGAIVKKDSGEISIIENVKDEHDRGRSTRVWADDKFFIDEKKMGQALGNTPRQAVSQVSTSSLFDEMHLRQFISETDYRRTQARYLHNVDSFKLGSGSYSERLDAFGGPLPQRLDKLGAADAALGATRGFKVAAGTLGGVAIPWQTWKQKLHKPRPHHACKVVRAAPNNNLQLRK